MIYLCLGHEAYSFVRYLSLCYHLRQITRLELKRTLGLFLCLKNTEYRLPLDSRGESVAC